MRMILLTGATGFVGQNLLRTLKERGTEVRCLVRDEARAVRLRSDTTELATGDVTDARSVAVDAALYLQGRALSRSDRQGQP